MVRAALPPLLALVLSAACTLRRPPAAVPGVAYHLEVEVPGGVASGETFEVSLVVRPVSPFHLSTPEATRLDFDGARGLGPRRVTLRPGDPGLTTNDRDRIGATASFTAQAPGPRELGVRARFVVCAEDRCQQVDARQRVTVLDRP